MPLALQQLTSITLYFFWSHLPLQLDGYYCQLLPWYLTHSYLTRNWDCSMSALSLPHKISKVCVCCTTESCSALKKTYLNQKNYDWYSVLLIHQQILQSYVVYIIFLSRYSVMAMLYTHSNQFWCAEHYLNFPQNYLNQLPVYSFQFTMWHQFLQLGARTPLQLLLLLCY